MSWVSRKGQGKNSGDEQTQAFSLASRSLDVDLAIDAHKDWSDSLFASLHKDAGKTLDIQVIGCADCCDLGQWIHHGDGDRYLKSYMTFVNLRKTHQQFHQTAAQVVIEFQQGHTDQAMQLLHGHFHELSQEIIRSLKNIKVIY
ncbi:MAG: CZB domain-containing protein [Pseudomonadales bacterium]|nr:CZB domain-containing protein [Pseudomonadales bacterium]